MRGCAQYAVSYGELIEEQSGLFRLNEEIVLRAKEETTGVELFSSPEDGVTAWIRWMGGQGQSLEELTWCRLRGLGLVYSATSQCGGEGRLYRVMVYECAN